MVIAHTASASWHHFHPWITKKMDLEPVSHFDTPNQQKIRKVPPMWTQETPQRHPKVNKKEHLDPMCPLGVPLDPWITKVFPRVPKMKPQGLQNDSFK